MNAIFKGVRYTSRFLLIPNSFALSEARATTGCRLRIALSEEKNPTTALVTGMQGSVTLFIGMKV